MRFCFLKRTLLCLFLKLSELSHATVPVEEKTSRAPKPPGPSLSGGQGFLQARLCTGLDLSLRAVRTRSSGWCATRVTPPFLHQPAGTFIEPRCRPEEAPFPPTAREFNRPGGGRGWEGEAAVRLPSAGGRRELALRSRRGCKVSRRPWSSPELHDSGGHAATTWPPRSHHSSQQPSPAAPPSAHTCFSLPLCSLSVQTFLSKVAVSSYRSDNQCSCSFEIHVRIPLL